MIRDPFDILSEDLDRHVEFTDECWAQIVAVIDKKLGRDANVITLPALDEPLPLRKHIEAALGSYHFEQEFMRRYPMRTARQIIPALENFHKALCDVQRSLAQPEVQLYGLDWGNDRGGPKSIIRFVATQRNELNMRLNWLSRLRPNEAYPGPAAPRDTAPAEGWQTHHRALTDDPERDLIGVLLRLYQEAFRRRPSITETGPAFCFLQAILSPVFFDLTDGRIRYWLRRSLER